MDGDCISVVQCIVESVSIMDIICGEDPSYVYRAFPCIKALYGRLNGDLAYARALLPIAQFYLNHSECRGPCPSRLQLSMSLIGWLMNASQCPHALISGEIAAVDSEVLFCQLFSQCPAEQFNEPMLAFELVQFCLLNAGVLQTRVANYRQSFPNLLKVSWLIIFIKKLSKIQDVWVCFFIKTDLEKCSITSLGQQWIFCSEWVPSEKESKQLIKTLQ